MKTDYWKGTKVISQSIELYFITVKNGSTAFLLWLLRALSRLFNNEGLYAEMYPTNLAAVSTRHVTMLLGFNKLIYARFMLEVRMQISSNTIGDSLTYTEGICDRVRKFHNFALR